MDNRIKIIFNAVQSWYCLLTLIKIMNENKRRIRRWWTKPFIMKNQRLLYGAHATVFRYFLLNDHEDFYRFLKMSVPQFNYLFELLRPKLLKRSRREPLSSELRVSIVLHFLANGGNVKASAFFFRIGISTMYTLIPEICKGIIEILKVKYLSFPRGDEWKTIANHFYQMWNMPNCIGSIDGKHLAIIAPPNSGSMFRNYKHHHSVVLMGMCDAFQRFIWANVGSYGSSNDAGIFQTSDLGILLNNNQLDLPQATNLPNSDIILPFFIVGDGGFPLKKFLMTPFSRSIGLTVPQKIFNYRLSRARRVVECAFGNITQKWKIFNSPLAFKLQTTECIIMAVIGLHNFLITWDMDTNPTNYIVRNHNFDEYEADNIEHDAEDIQQYEQNVIDIRNNLASYFVSAAGALDWQWERI